ARYSEALLAHLDPETGGFTFDPVRHNAVQASAGGMNFAYLFLGFSAFLIGAALLLVGLLFRLNLDRRAREVGVLFAEGYRRGAVRGLLLGEGALLAAAGALLGVGLALLYSRLLLSPLGALWPGGGRGSFLARRAE